MKITLWTLPKRGLWLNISFIIAAILACILLLLLDNNQLDLAYKLALGGSILLSTLFLIMYALWAEFNENQLNIRLLSGTRTITYDQIDHVRLTRKMNNEYVIIHLKRPLLIRRSISFLIKKNDANVCRVLNEMIDQRIKIYHKPDALQSIKFNKCSGKFSILSNQ